ncbi:MAG: hypothetical protein HQK69_09945 [Desulfamplus sp.]|nr:hypothetical protein [Desulfamplus sp.]
MKNRKALGLLVALMVSVLCVGNVFAFDASARDDSSRVTVGQNYYGDVLLGQIYQTQWNYSSTIKVINTSTTRAIVAKVVFRSAVCSTDVRDFVIYLTPTDMWEGEVRVDANGAVEIYSTDDSVLASREYDWDGTAACNPFTGVWASEETPFRVGFVAAGAGDTNLFGHIEVHGLAAYPATAPLDKDTLAMAYGNMAGVPAVGIAGLIACDFNLDGDVEDVPNVLTGILSLENSYFDQLTSINMTALKNWNDTPIFINTTSSSGLNLSTDNTVVETEAALAKTEYSIPFDFSADTGYADTIIINMLPTHYLAGTGGSGIFTITCSGLAGLVYNVYDMMETRLISYLSPVRFLNTLPEVSMQALLPNIRQAVAAGYEKGWVKVTLPGAGTGIAMDGVSRVNYAGAPIINSYINVNQNGDLDWSYAASPESVVTYTIGTNTVQVRQ